MRLLVTGASGLLGSNLAAAAAQQSWSVLATWNATPVSLLGARTAPLDLADRRACVALAEELEPDVVVHTGALADPGAYARDPRLSELELRGAEHTLAAARAVHARYALVSCDLVFSGLRRAGECWEEEDPTEPTTARGRSLLACEQLTRRHENGWLIARPAEVYGVNLAIPAPDAPGARARHVWERSGPALRTVARLRSGRIAIAPAGVRRTPTYARDFAQRLCELLAQECEGAFNMAGPTILGRLAATRMLARAFDCEPDLVRDGAGGLASLAPNTALCDRRASFVLGRPGIDPFSGLRLMRGQLMRLLDCADPPGEMGAKEASAALVTQG